LHTVELLLWTSWGLLEAGISVVIVWFGGLFEHRRRATVGDIMAFQWYMFCSQSRLEIVTRSEMQRSLARWSGSSRCWRWKTTSRPPRRGRNAPALVADAAFDG